jgi:lipopolysaccharide/colanic/teichoic acid biosynthesis glycosyltransferase
MTLAARDNKFREEPTQGDLKSGHLTLIDDDLSPTFRERFSLNLYFFIKRTVDVLLGLLMLACAIPVMLVVALVIKLTSPGPVILRQKRLTMNGKVFTIYKFRSMKVNAESVSGPVLASQNDPRITKFGWFLRKTRLDELPQLVNVLIGDMSLVGPRPERPEIAQTLSKVLRGFDRRVAVKAGLTGLAQVKADYPSDVQGYKKKLALDILYTKRHSLLLDIKILIRTISVVILGKGAK